MLHTLIGIAYLQLFVINNFVGPKTELNNTEQSTAINDLLTCDGETLVATIHYSDYLYQATKIFNTESNKTAQNWVCRSIRIKYLIECFIFRLITGGQCEHYSFIKKC